MARKNSVVSSGWDSGILAFEIVGGNADSSTAVIEIHADKLTDDIREHAMFHGLTQKISDAAALGKDATPSDKYAAMKAVADRLLDGEWKQSRGEGAGPVAGVIYRAFSQWVMDMAKAKKVAAPSPDAVRAVYDSKTRAEQLALRNVPAIAAIIETIKAAKTPAKALDTDELLAGLGL